MTLFKLARRNMARNFLQYFLYFGSMIFSVLIFFTFVSIQYNGEAQAAASDSVKINASFQAASIILLIFVAIFIWYSNSFFTRRRKKEIGLYAMMGLRKKQIGWMLFYENLILGAMSLAVGIFIGMVLSKFFIMILMKLMGVAVTVHFSISTQAIVETVVVFLIVILLTSLYGYRLIYRFQLVDLFHDEKKGDRTPKVSRIQSLCAVLLIGTGYWVALQELNSVVWHRLGLLGGALLILFCVITGTFLLFRSLTVYFIKSMKKRKSFYYQGTNIIGISQLFYRIAGNARILTVIATMSAVTLVSVGTSYSLYYKVGEWTRQNNPHSYEYVVPSEVQAKADRLFKEKVKEDGKHKITSQKSVPVMNVQAPMLNFSGHSVEMMVISDRVFNELAQYSSNNKLVHLTGNNAMMFSVYMDKDTKKMYKGKDVALSSERKNVKGKLATIHYIDAQKIQLTNSSTSEIIVVSEVLYHRIQEKNGTQIMTQVDVSDQESSGSLTKMLSQSMARFTNDDEGSKFVSFYSNYHLFLSAYGLIMFLGAFLGIVFLLATGSIIYFKQLNEGAQEKSQYAILKKVGLTRLEIRGTVAKQVGFIFALPLIIGIAHSAIALVALSHMIVTNLTLPVVICMGIYALIYSIYYLFTVRAYTKMVAS